MENKEYQLLCTFLKDRYYISTMYRKSTANTANPWHFEIIIWEWNAMVEIDDSGTDEEQAIVNHFTAVKSMNLLIANESKTKEIIDGQGLVLKEGDIFFNFLPTATI